MSCKITGGYTLCIFEKKWKFRRTLTFPIRRKVFLSRTRWASSYTELRITPRYRKIRRAFTIRFPWTNLRWCTSY
jgi:hypothetical protein